MRFQRTVLAVLTSAIIVSTGCEAWAKDAIRMGMMVWEDQMPMTKITKKVLEDAGYDVQVTEFSEWGIAFAALTRGDIQISVTVPNYVNNDYWVKSSKKLEKISPVSHGLYQALAVPKYVPINSIEDLNASADKFGDKIIAIEPGTGLNRQAQDAVQKYGLKLEVVEGSTAGMTSALKSAVDRKEWIVAAIWQPSWMFQKYDMKFLADPKGVFPSPDTYYWIAKKGFSAENPKARELISSIFVSLDDVSSINASVADGKTMDEAVSAWLASHADLVKRWEEVGSAD